MSEAQETAIRAKRRSPFAWLWKSATALFILSVLIYLLLKHQGERVISPWDAVLFGVAYSVLLPFASIGLYLLPERRRAQFYQRILPSTLLAFVPVGIGLFYLKAAVRYGALENYPAMQAASAKFSIYFQIGYALLILSLLVVLFFSVCGWWHHWRGENRSMDGPGDPAPRF